jgi:hypothetical protein
MSRGADRIEAGLRAIFEKEDGLFSTFDLVVKVYGVEPAANAGSWVSEAQLSAVRRTLIALSKQGLVCSSRGYHDRRQRWGTPQAWLREEENEQCSFGHSLRAVYIKHGRKAFETAKQR